MTIHGILASTEPHSLRTVKCNILNVTLEDIHLPLWKLVPLFTNIHLGRQEKEGGLQGEEERGAFKQGSRQMEVRYALFSTIAIMKLLYAALSLINKIQSPKPNVNVANPLCFHKLCAGAYFTIKLKGQKRSTWRDTNYIV